MKDDNVYEYALRYRLALGATGHSSTAQGGGGGIGIGPRGSFSRTAKHVLQHLSNKPFLSQPPTETTLTHPSSSIVAATSSEKQQPQHDKVVDVEEVIRELRLFQIELNKMYAQWERTVTETEGIQPQEQQQRDVVRRLEEAVRDRRNQLRICEQVHSCQTQYETLARNMLPLHRGGKIIGGAGVGSSGSAAQTQTLAQQVQNMDAHIRHVEHELTGKKATWTVRNAQVQLLAQCILDLKESLVSSDPIIPEQLPPLLESRPQNPNPSIQSSPLYSKSIQSPSLPTGYDSTPSIIHNREELASSPSVVVVPSTESATAVHEHGNQDDSSKNHGEPTNTEEVEAMDVADVDDSHVNGLYDDL